jgi:hypothetical protein
MLEYNDGYYSEITVEQVSIFLENYSAPISSWEDYEYARIKSILRPKFAAVDSSYA